MIEVREDTYIAHEYSARKTASESQTNKPNGQFCKDLIGSFDSRSINFQQKHRRTAAVNLVLTS